VALPLVVLLFAIFALVREPRAAGLALVTLRISAAVATFSLALGTLLAIIIAKANLPARNLFVWLWCWALFLPLYVQASAWDAGFGLQGWFTQLRGDVSHAWLVGERAAIWIHTLAATPWALLLVALGLRQVEPDLEELALLDAPPWLVLLGVTLPRALPAMVGAWLLIAVLVAGEMTVTDIYRVRAYAEEIYTNAALTVDAVELGLSVWPHLAIVALLAILAWQAAEALAPTAERSPQRSAVRFDLGPWRWPVFLFVAAVTLVAIGFPLGNLIYKAGFAVDASGEQLVRRWTWERFAQATFPRELLPWRWQFYREYQSTLLIAGTSATLTVIVAAVLAWLARSGAWRGGASRRSAPAMLMCAVGLALPGPLIALGVIWLLNRPSPAILPWLYDRTVLAPALTISIRTLPLAILLLWAAFRTLSTDQVEAARVDGAGWWSLLLFVALPQRWEVVAIAWLGAFALAAGDLAASLLVYPPGMMTISIQIFQLIHAGVHNEEAGLCLGQAALFGVLSAAVLALVARNQRRYS
jgi:iron(III) transport system permease protein